MAVWTKKISKNATMEIETTMMVVQLSAKSKVNGCAQIM